MSRAWATLVVLSRSLSPERLAQLIGVEGDEVRVKGSPKTPTSRHLRFARRIRDLEPSASVEQVREQALAEVRHLLEAGYMEVCRSAERGGFDPWGTGPEEPLDRIAREWEALGRDPNIPDICWFSSTALGDEVARELLSSSGPSADRADT